ncbi:hypothetical protein [Pseudemcibacter aquimaris]|uniref:hypothetical protein n=1 Tax=Pseudemcibacter aquimaris TaxID=2857064 RepID=UPI0020110BB1|nr:hypothetical protein [Pseudemcibacter aquimaris]MCC3861054.1 hypothetical protein [Pseudemcibacter aquimaris]WDU59872.1 hypothetical protein KW060_06340 [Pseudemcibacter aquimaris]
MYIKPGFNESEKRKKLITEIDHVFMNSPLKDPICNSNCSAFESNESCDKMCSLAPKMLSNTPEHPVEENIAPLVFEIKKLGIFQPCWSCEGHNDPNGQLWKKPNIWFYCQSVVHARAFSNAIDMIYNMKTLSTRWVVELTHSDIDNPDTTFCLKPMLEDTNVSLKDLHKDIEVLYMNLSAKFRLACEKLRKSAM